MKRRNIVKLFESRTANLDRRLEHDYVKNGIATLPCRINEYEDIISPYSVKGLETLNMDFFEYVTEAAGFADPKYPLVINIVGNCLSGEEKRIIKITILDTFAYHLGKVEKDEKRHTKTFILMFLGLLISGILLWCTHSLAEEPREMLFILFWFMGDTLCDYLFLTGYDLRRERRMAGRLASIKVLFSDEYVEPNYTDSDVERLFSEIKNEVKETRENMEKY